MKILWITNYPSPYRVDFFTELGKYVKLTVVFENTIEQQTHRNKDWFNSNYSGFTPVFLKQSGKADMIHQASKYVFDKSYDLVVLGDYSTPISVAIAFKLIIKRIKYAISIDGAYLRKGNLIKDALKRCIISGACFYLSSSNTSDEYLKHYGADEKVIYRYSFTSLKNKDVLSSPLCDAERNKLRAELKLNDKISALLVGRFVPIKGIDFVLKHAKKYESLIDFYIAGDNPTKEYLEIIDTEKIHNVYFIGFQKKEELKKYYQACDLFLFPTRYDPWGLVVNEAMANAMPILSTDKSSAALHFIKNGVNGYIYPVDDVKMYEKYLEELCSGRVSLREMGKINLQMIQSYTIEKMALEHNTIFEKYFEDKEE